MVFSVQWGAYRGRRNEGRAPSLGSVAAPLAIDTVGANPNPNPNACTLYYVCFPLESWIGGLWW